MSFIPEDTLVCTDVRCKNPKMLYKLADYKEHRRCEPEPCPYKDFKKSIINPENKSFKINESFNL